MNLKKVCHQHPYISCREEEENPNAMAKFVVFGGMQEVLACEMMAKSRP